MYDDDVAARVLCSGATLHVHGEELYITMRQCPRPHFHRLPLAAAEECGDCCLLSHFHTLTDAQLIDLWESVRTDPYFDTTYDVDTGTLHPEWIATDETGEPYFTRAFLDWDPPTPPRPPAALLLIRFPGTNADLIRAVADRYMPEGALVADVTYGKGVFWRKCTHRRFTLYASDLKRISVDPALLDGEYPMRIVTRRVDFRQLPYDAAFFDIVVLDPPYIHHPGTHMMDARYNNAATTKGLSHADIIAERYLPGMIEAARVLKPGGQLWVKGKSEIESGKQRWASLEIPILAEAYGYFTLWDEAILETRPPNPHRWKRQLNPRNCHSFLYMFDRTARPVEVLGSHGGYRGRRPAHTERATPDEMITLMRSETNPRGTVGPSLGDTAIERHDEMVTLIHPKTKQRGTSSQYLIDRLTRDHPHMLVRLKAGEFRSVRAAAVAAGIIKPRR
jgi:hypothetical protein